MPGNTDHLGVELGFLEVRRHDAYFGVQAIGAEIQTVCLQVGKRRLGRAGLDRTYSLPDNVWDIDCSTLLDPNVNGFAIHGEYFNPDEDTVYKLLRAVLEGHDRTVLIGDGLFPTAMPRAQVVAVPAPAAATT